MFVNFLKDLRLQILLFSILSDQFPAPRKTITKIPGIYGKVKLVKLDVLYFFSNSVVEVERKSYALS